MKAPQTRLATWLLTAMSILFCLDIILKAIKGEWTALLGLVGTVIVRLIWVFTADLVRPYLQRLLSFIGSPEPGKPPLNAEFLLCLFLDKQNCDAIIGDLEERYKLIQKKFGTLRANFWYWTQAVRSIGPIAWAWAKKLATKPLLAFVTWIAAKGFLGRNSWLPRLAESLLDLYRRIRN